MFARSPACLALQYAAGDLLISFRQETGSYELVVDLGAATNLYSLTPGSTVNITNYTPATINFAFSDLSDLKWSVTASAYRAIPNQPARTCWATRPRLNLEQQSVPWTRGSILSQSQAASKMDTVGRNVTAYSGNFASDPVQNTDTAVVIAAGDTYAYSRQVGPNGDFGGVWEGLVENTTPPDFVSSQAVVRSDLYECQPSTTPAPGKYWGYFEFKWDGTMTFTAAGGVAVPAPALVQVAPATGPAAGETLVTLTGSNFVSGATVKIGGLAATAVNFVNAESITAKTPAHAGGLVEVVVTNPDGQTATLAGAYTYTEVVPVPGPAVTKLSPVSGPVAGGTVVTLTGSNFVNGVTVSFGGTAATAVTFVSATSLTATAPAHAHAAGAVDVVVTNPDGQSATLAGAFTYTEAVPVLKPAVTQLSPVTGPLAGGTVVTLTGSNFVNGATVSFGGTASATVTFVSAESISATTPAHAPGAVDVVVTNPNGQTGALAGGYTYADTVPTKPANILSVSLAGADLILVTSGATNGVAKLVTSAELGAPVSTWTPVATNSVGSDGLYTNTVALDPAAPHRFYAVTIP